MTKSYPPIRKSLGQHFLVDAAVIARIIKSLAIKPDEHWLEIGPGRGALTTSLIDTCEHLTLIEYDRELAKLLTDKYADNARVEVIQANALNVDLNEINFPGSSAFAEDDEKRVQGDERSAQGDDKASENTKRENINKQLNLVGNLPYNISTPLLLKFMAYKNIINKMIFMLQEEVVARICAEPGNKTYGRLSVMLQYHFDCEYLFEVPPSAFNPPPKVNSAIVQLTPKQTEPEVVDLDFFAEIVNQAFQQRRKTLSNSLKKYVSADELNSLGFDAKLRPEVLSVSDWAKLSNQIKPFAVKRSTK